MGIIGFLYITDASGGKHVGTGFLISKNYMLTAAHCVHMSGKPVKSITAYFGANGNNYGVRAYSSVVGWCSSYPSNKSIANDWGCIKLSSNAGNTCGWFGIGYTTKANLQKAKFTVCGSPIYNSSTKIVYGIHHGEAVSGSTNGGARITKGIFTNLKDIGACS